MATRAKNQLAVASTAYTEAASMWLGPPPATKLVLVITGGAVYLQTSDEVARGAWVEPATQAEVYLPPGFHSREFSTPVYAWRLRAASGASPATVSVNTDP